MDSTFKSNQQTVSARSEETVTNSNFWEEAESNRYAIAPLLLFIVAVFAAIAGATVMRGTTLQVAAIAFPALISLAMMLAVAPMRIIVLGAVLSVIADVLVMVLS